MTTLDSFGVTTPTEKAPLVKNDDHARYLYETSYERIVDKQYDNQIKQFLADEKEAKEEEIMIHNSYVESNYIRVGGN